ncbi:MAG: BON domain-containing protein [Gammaproteobacteria bacterium]|nr:BON domain-containing protein [Gammaproteobacteria bacterium]
MNRSMAAWIMAGLLAVVMGLAAGCQGYRDGSSRTVGEYTDDVGIQSRVKLALLNDSDIKGLVINTEVRKGVVTLHGRVNSHEQKEQAVALAAGVKGVRRVDDRLTVVTE